MPVSIGDDVGMIVRPRKNFDGEPSIRHPMIWFHQEALHVRDGHFIPGPPERISGICGRYRRFMAETARGHR